MLCVATLATQLIYVQKLIDKIKNLEVSSHPSTSIVSQFVDSSNSTLKKGRKCPGLLMVHRIKQGPGRDGGKGGSLSTV